MFEDLFNDRPYRVETARALNEKTNAVSLHTVAKHSLERKLLEVSSAGSDYGNSTSPKGTEGLKTNVADWLPFAAEKYNISADLKDYVIVPVPIVASDIPNRNLACFPFEVLTEFDPETGLLNYRSWKGKPTFVEHDNHDYTKAKGVIFDSTLQKLQGSVSDIWKVVALCGFDRNVDPVLCENILSGRSTGYSMGSKVFGYGCSVCGATTSRPDRPNCSHVDPTRRELRFVEMGNEKRLSYWNVVAFRGFETSSVVDPAFLGADSPFVIDAGR